MNAVDVSEYVYVDTAQGGVDRRNNVRRLSEIRLNGLSDCYASHGRATDTLATWIAEHTNKDGKPTVAGFNGLTWAPNLHLDFDAEGNLPLALTYLLRVLDRLESWGVDLLSVRIYFSGAKGFHLEIPHTLFGGFVPSADFHKRLRRAVKKILSDIPFDTSVYDALRLWRLENTKNSKTGLYKIRLTVTEARTAEIDDILALAMQARDTGIVPELALIDDDEWMAVDELIGIWAATIVADEPDATTEHHAPTNQARDSQTSAAIAASWPHGGSNATEGETTHERVSRHAEYLLPLAGFLARRTSAEHVIAVLAGGAEQAGDQTFLHGRDWRSEIQRIVDGAGSRIEHDEEVRGLPSLAKNFPALATVIRALWPDPTFEFDTFSPTRLHALPDQKTEPDEPAAPFPLDVLPPALRSLVTEGAAALPCPPDLIAIPLLTAAGVAIGDAIELELKPGWREAANQYTAVVGDPGSKKTPAQKLALQPLFRIQQRLKSEYDAERTDYKVELANWEKTPKKGRGAPPEPPVFRHVVTTDATIEATAPMLLGGKGIQMWREELSGWVRAMNQYRAGGKGADRQLSIHVVTHVDQDRPQVDA